MPTDDKIGPDHETEEEALARLAGTLKQTDNGPRPEDGEQDSAILQQGDLA